MDDDPWCWGTEQIISHLCHSTETWSRRPNCSRPDPVKLEAVLREQRLDGATLLEEVDKDVLKNELGLQFLSERSAILWAIDQLRNYSDNYRASIAARVKPSTPKTNPDPQLLHSRFRDDSVSNTSGPVASSMAVDTHYRTNAHLRQSEVQSDLPMIKQERLTPLQMVYPTRDFDQHMIELSTSNNLPIQSRPDICMNLLPTVPPLTPIPSPKRPVGQFIEIISSEMKAEREEAENIVPSQPDEPANVEQRPKKRRIKPSTVQELSTESIQTSQVDRSNAFLNREKLLVDSLFYDEYQHGDVMDCGSDDETGSFSFQASDSSIRIPPGLAAFTHRRMKHYLSHPPAEVNASKLISYPYPDRLTPAKCKRSATTFTQSGDEVIVRKIDASLLGSPLEEAKLEQQADGDNSWDYLLARYPPVEDDTALPLYEESGSENNYDQSLLDEMEHEEILIQTQDTRSKMLAQEEVTRTIDTVIESFRVSWQEKHALSCQARAWSVWRSARGRNSVDIVLQNKQQLEHLDSRLAKFKNDMMHDSWTSSKSLRNQCKSLEETVNSQEEIKWKLHLWQSRQEPQRILKAKPKKSMKPKPHAVDEESESVGSESDGLDDFIEIDESGDEASGPAAFTTEETGFPNQLAAQEAPEQDIEDATMQDQVPQHQQDELLVIDKVDNQPVESVANEASYRITDSVDSEPPILPDGGVSKDQEATEDIDLSVATENDIETWDWTLLDKQRDRKRIVVKLLHSMPSDRRQRVEKQILEHKQHRSKLKDKIQRTLTALSMNRDTISGIHALARPTFFSIARLWVCWNTGNHRYYETIIPSIVVKPASKAKDFPAFFEFICSRVEVANESEPESAEEETPTPYSKRKKKVIRSQQGVALQKLAQQRLAEFEAKVQKLEQERQSGKLVLHNGKIVVNVMKLDDDEPIFLNPHIESRIKSHQIDGLRFLWREIVSASNSTMQGCLLAHTMGLGKTMQTISLLATIAEAAGDPTTVNQIPENLRRAQILILCPPGLIENWKNETKAWIPPELKTILKVFEVVSGDTTDSRLATIDEWNSKGGILLLGYSLFRTLADPPTPISNQEDVDAEARIKASRSLLEGSTIVVLDEAHKIKNRYSKIAQEVSRFLTPSRIALTGSPLSNNIENYYAMIDWVAPGYLGDILEFKAFYQEPIEAGMYADVPKSWIRNSMKKSQALKRDIEPKAHRASAIVLTNDLKPKTEFVLMLQLREWQKKAYLAFLESIKGGSEYAVMQAKLFDVIQLLTLLCAHPAIFLESLNQRRESSTQNGAPSTRLGVASGAKKRSKQSTTPFDEDTDNSLIEDVSEEHMEVSDILIQRQREVKPKSESESAINVAAEFSAKMIIIRDIVLQAKRIGDQVLIFSQRLSILDYVAEMLNNLPGSIKYFRLEGKTPPTSREMMVKAFNAGSRDVFLISTLAGGLGLNIASANRVILVDFSHNPMHEEQAVGRAYRIGQTKPVFVYHLVAAGTFEATLHNATIFKKQLASTMVDKKNLKRAASKENVYLAEPKDVSQSALEPFRGKDEIMDFVLDGDAGSLIREIKTADTMQAESDELLEEHELQEVETMRTEYHARTGGSAVKQRE